MIDDKKHIFGQLWRLCKFCVLTVFIFLSAYSTKAQLVAGEYSSITLISDDFHINSSNSSNCYDYEIDLNSNAYYNVTGMINYFFLDSMQSSSDSLKIWHEHQIQYLHVEDSIVFGNNVIPIYVDTATTVYYTIKAFGTPMIDNESYDCEFIEQHIWWVDGCNNEGIWFRANTDSCTVLPGEFQLINDSCNAPIELIPGLNWANNFNATAEPNIDISCFDDVESNTAENGVWYSFTTPEDYKRIRLSTSSTQCDTVELVGTQMAIFTSCDSEPFACSSPGDSLFADITFDCGELELNTTYYVLLDGWAGETGICRLYYSIMNACPPGCMDSTACNYNDNAFTDDGSCLYGDACIPTHELTVDTIDCQNYVINSDLGWSPFFEPWFKWTINGYPLFESIMPYSLNLSDLAEGNHEICLFVYHTQGLSETCIQIYVPEDCDNPCTSEITTSFLGCDAEFTIEPSYPTDSIFVWNFGNGISVEGGTQITQTYEEEGEYTACVDLTNYAGCLDTTLCTTLIAPNCDIDSSLFGCTDTLACNYNPDVLFDDGSCIYTIDCIPDIILSIDTIDCQTFIFSVSLEFDIAQPVGWFLNSELLDLDYSEHSFNVNNLTPGTHTVCYIIIGLGSSTPTCVEIYVPESCGQECTSEITAFELGCGMLFTLNEMAPDSVSFLWDFGNGETLESGSETFHLYTEDGMFSTCIYLDDYQGCVDTTICTDFIIDGCEPDSLVYGCTDSLALNFDSLANISDSSCVYPGDCAFNLSIDQDGTDPLNYVVSSTMIDTLIVDILWEFGDGESSDQLFFEHTYTTAGTYLVCCTATLLIDSVECEASDCVSLTLLEEGGNISYSLGGGIINGVYNLDKDIGLNLWPNPANDMLHWKLTKVHTSSSLRIYSSTGQELLKTNTKGSTEGDIRLDSFQPGIYYLIVKGDFGISQSKFVVIK